MIHIHDSSFIDSSGRRLMLRGVNLGGSSKVPTRPNGATHLKDGLRDHRSVSFVGRPFPLDQADAHFRRLRAWGLTTLRFLVTWEAVEHAGPGIYDEEYLDYLTEVVRKAGEHGLLVFIDPHQDVWSRFTGGDGAPGWTLEAIGFDLDHLDEVGAAFTHQHQGDPFPRMIWPTNNDKLAAATLFTLFFGGNDFAPHCRIDGVPVQDYLQSHYIAAMQAIARRLAGMEHVIGFDTLNEPSHGYIGRVDLTQPHPIVHNGNLPSPLQAMALGDGIPQEVEYWTVGLLGERRAGKRWLNTHQMRAWQNGQGCVWRAHGVWEPGPDGAPRLLKPDYFSHVNGRAVNFSQDYLRPFANRVSAAIREILPQALMFVESDPDLPMPVWGPQDAAQVVSAPHWYDATVLFLKTFLPWLGYDTDAHKMVFGAGAIRRSYANQFKRKKAHAALQMAGAPCLIGETGIAYDLNGRKAYRSGDFRDQEGALDRIFRALEDNLLHATLWNYTSDHDVEHGDQWNGEDLSIFSPPVPPTDDLNQGGRALRAVVRPYPTATAGQPLRLSFNYRAARFEFEYQADPAVSAPTLIYLPTLHYPGGFAVECSSGEWNYDRDTQLLSITGATGRVRLFVRPL